ncbi:hypothetical protein PHMEG_0008798 [Phytophthora megakarya]|uniref:Uncharacterized protein n=1 Tax=Phytophthora megakarya TaxID=4795 RepID=A0A225WJ52_9STRA|nr:hypothetical protein PHMEG_0008798 [Phytophthora megakarya]
MTAPTPRPSIGTSTLEPNIRPPGIPPSGQDSGQPFSVTVTQIYSRLTLERRRPLIRCENALTGTVGRATSLSMYVLDPCAEVERLSAVEE